MKRASQKSVIEPRRGAGEKPVQPGVLMGFTRQDLTLIRQSIGVNSRSNRRLDFASTWRCPSPWGNVQLVGPALGAPAAVFLMERVIALGAICIVAVGSCGSLQPELNIGQVILPTGALVEEGTSGHYRCPGVRTAPHALLLAAMRGQLRTEGICPVEGRVWTTDAPFRETIDKVTRYRQEGILAVDMEASALMTVASFRGIPFASVLVVSDEIGALKWKRRFTDPAYRQGLVSVAHIAVRVLSDKVNPVSSRAADGKAQ